MLAAFYLRTTSSRSAFVNERMERYITVSKKERNDAYEESTPSRIIGAPPLPRTVGLSVADGADALGVTRQAVHSLIRGRAGISPEMAIRLDKAFGGGAETWLRIQAAYDPAQAGKKSGKKGQARDRSDETRSRVRR